MISHFQGPSLTTSTAVGVHYILLYLKCRECVAYKKSDPAITIAQYKENNRDVALRWARLAVVSEIWTLEGGQHGFWVLAAACWDIRYMDITRDERLSFEFGVISSWSLHPPDACMPSLVWIIKQVTKLQYFSPQHTKCPWCEKFRENTRYNQNLLTVQTINRQYKNDINPNLA